ELKLKLVALQLSDQKLRIEISTLDTMRNMNVDLYNKKRDSLWQIQNQIDDTNFLVLRHIVKTYSWPTYSLVGKDAAHTAWLILQHCNDSFQKACLPLLKEAVKNQEASEIDLAYLTDRILMSNSQKQIYGTQYQ